MEDEAPQSSDATVQTLFKWWHAIVAVVAGVGAVFTVFTVKQMYMESSGIFGAQFDSETWKQGPIGVQRQEMVVSLLSDVELVGMPSSDVEELLGAPKGYGGARAKGYMLYPLGTEVPRDYMRGGEGGDEYLVIELGTDERVAKTSRSFFPNTRTTGYDQRVVKPPKPPLPEILQPKNVLE